MNGARNPFGYPSAYQPGRWGEVIYPKAYSPGWWGLEVHRTPPPPLPPWKKPWEPPRPGPTQLEGMLRAAERRRMDQARQLAEAQRQEQARREHAERERQQAERRRQAEERQRQIRDRLTRDQAQRDQVAREQARRDQAARERQTRQRAEEQIRQAQERVRHQLGQAVLQAQAACQPYRRPQHITPGPRRLYQASEVLTKVTPQDWRDSINEARAEYARAGGDTRQPLTLDQVKHILDVAGTYNVFEDAAIWHQRMAHLRALGEPINDQGFSADCEFRAGEADTTRRVILINPYLRSESLRRGTQLHELEHIVKELAGVPSGAPAVQLPGRSPDDTVHHVTSHADRQRTILRWEPARKKWWHFW
jgi:hypothetical protein